uniref:Surfactin synthase subunit 1 n=1 Tax=Anthurium amnicola TaxID=1678845 RepID=A0A1D1ZIJ8_9ARAE
MGNLHEKLLSFFLLLFISIPFYVSAYPEGAGTCDVAQMSVIGHMKSNLQGSGGYSMNAKMLNTGKFQLTINGNGKFKGMLVYVLDSSNNRVGEFVNLPANIQIKTDCKGQATVTHKDATDKSFPFNLNYSTGTTGTTGGNLTIKSLVVKDFSDWAKLDDITLDPVTGDSSIVTGGSQDTTTGSTGSDNFLQKYSLFIIMIGITTLLYIVGSVTEAMLKRQQVKSRSFAKTIQNGFGDSR